MSCINATVRRLCGIDAAASRVGGIDAAASRVGGISVSVSLLCDVGVSKFLRVIPEEMQWITVTTPVEYDVLSNVEWRVL